MPARGQLFQHFYTPQPVRIRAGFRLQWQNAGASISNFNAATTYARKKIQATVVIGKPCHSTVTHSRHTLLNRFSTPRAALSQSTVSTASTPALTT